MHPDSTPSQLKTDHTAEIREAVRNANMYASGLIPEDFQRVEGYLAEVNEHADALTQQRDALDAVHRAAAAYIKLLERGAGPSDSSYLPLRDCYRNAVEDLLREGQT